jgi:uncharacterized protein YqhQ
MAKEKTATAINIDGVDYTEDQLSDQAKMVLNHMGSLDQKIRAAHFNLQQLEIGRKAFGEMLREELDKMKNDENAEEIEAA